MSAIFDLNKWFEITSRGTSGDQVSDILYSWKHFEEILRAENETLRERLRQRESPYNRELSDMSSGFIQAKEEMDNKTIKELSTLVTKLRAQIEELENKLDSANMLGRYER